MLSRVAESLVWMGRYLERADNVGRIVEAIDRLTIDNQHPELSNTEAFWEPVTQILAVEVEEDLESASQDELLDLLLFSEENRNSLFSCVVAARFNARSIRDQLMNELWEVINDLYLFLKESKKDAAKRINVSEIGSKVRFSIHCIRGLVESSMNRDEGWCFLMLGMKLEKSDQTSRLLDLKSFTLSEDGKHNEILEPYIQLAVIQVSGMEIHASRNLEKNWVLLEKALMFDLVNPHSIRSSVRKVNQVLHVLSSSKIGVFGNNAKKVCGRLQADLDYKSFDGMTGSDLHEYLDHIQKSLGEVFSGVLETYTHQSEEVFAQEQSQ